MEGQGWHGWLWRLRFVELRAETAAARGDHARAAELARESIAQSRAKRRGKYEAYARVTLARSLAAQGRKREALGELYAATAIAGRLGNPALQVMVSAALLAVEPDDVVAAVDRVLAALSDPTLRDRFLRADDVREVVSA